MQTYLKFFMLLIIMNVADIVPACAQIVTEAGDETFETLILSKSMNFRTICVPYSIHNGGDSIEIYSIAGKVTEMGEVTGIVLQHEENPKAGMPYIFRPTREVALWRIMPEHATAIASTPQSLNGLYGTFENIQLNDDSPLCKNDNIYAIEDNAIQKCKQFSFISRFRAYINMDEVPEYNAETSTTRATIIIK